MCIYLYMKLRLTSCKSLLLETWFLNQTKQKFSSTATQDLPVISRGENSRGQAARISGK